MNSVALLPLLEAIEVGQGSGDSLGSTNYAAHIWKTDAHLFGVEALLAVESVAATLFDARHIDDSYRGLMEKAYELAFGNSGTSLHAHFSEMVERGPLSVEGFISNLKGKMAELVHDEMLKERFPDMQWAMGGPTQPVWDHIGLAPDGTEVLVQSKVGAESYASGVIERMDASPDVSFMLSSELYNSIASQRPDLVEQMMGGGIENTSFTEDAASNVTLLAENFGLDVPDSLVEVTPYLGEIILGIRLLFDIAAVERDLANFATETKRRLQALRALMLMQRFGVTALLVFLGGSGGAAIGSPAPVAGNAVGAAIGSLSGAVAAAFLNNKIKPRALQLALALTSMSWEDCFYFQNKKVIDRLGASLSAMPVADLQIG